MNTETIVLIVSILFVFGVYIFVLIMAGRWDFVRGFIPRRRIRVAQVLGLLFGCLVVTYLFYHLYEIEPNYWVEISLLVGLVGATVVYALLTFTQAREIREQRIMSARPVIIQKALREKDVYQGSTSNYFSHFEVYNAGNGPAIELEISLLPYKEKGAIPPGERQTFLRAGQSITFYPPNLSNLPKPAKYYLVSEYQSTLSRGAKPTWYQTWLLFELYKSSIEGKMEVVSGDLEFRDEVPEKDRINAFRGRKPK